LSTDACRRAKVEGDGTTEYLKTLAGLEIRAIVVRRKSNPQAKWLHRAWANQRS
jgi:hypothetical protein